MDDLLADFVAETREMLEASRGSGSNFSIRDIAKMLGCSPTTVKAVKAELAASSTPNDS